MSEVAEQLAIARSAHEEFRQHMPRRVPSHVGVAIVSGDKATATRAIQRAYDARAAAEALDPPGADPAWNDDIWTGVHYALLKFYLDQLAA